MPTYDHYMQQQAVYADQYAPHPHPGAALMPSGQQYGMDQYGSGQVTPYRGGARSRQAAQQAQAASQARVIAARAAGQSEAAYFRYQNARPFSRSRRERRGQWERAESHAIEATYVAQAFTFESMFNSFFGLWD